MSLDKGALYLCIIVIFITGFIYYPKWKQEGTEATLSWDVSGYYMYLPAIFIYKDITRCDFKDNIIKTYKPTPDFQQAFLHTSGNYVMKYSAGQAIQFLPAFTISHLITKYFTDYRQDGFSKPYQLGISIHSFLVAIIGLIYLTKILNHFFNPLVTAIVSVSIVLGSNYLDYAAINGAMTHNGLFTIYCALIWYTIKFHQCPNFRHAILIGCLIGLAVLTRPTEIIAILIPTLWGVSIFKDDHERERMKLSFEGSMQLIVSVLVIVSIGSIQLFYWKYVTGEWFVYSYQDQGFSWLRPHILEGLFSYKSGWLIYSPLFVLLIPGFFILYRTYKNLFASLFVFSIIFIYIAFAWDIWWYGGSLGQRSMVQSYPVIAIVLGAFIERVVEKRLWIIVVSFFITFCVIYNLWLTHQAHRGGLFHAGEMTKAYYWKTLFRFTPKEEYLKLLDTDEEFTGMMTLSDSLYFNDFENDTLLSTQGFLPIEGRGSIYLSKEKQFSREFRTEALLNQYSWFRAVADFKCVNKEWETWKMAQFVIKLLYKGNEVKSRLIRIHRHLDDNEIQEIFFDIKNPGNVDEIKVYFWNAGSDKSLIIDNLLITGII